LAKAMRRNFIPQVQVQILPPQPKNHIKSIPRQRNLIFQEN